MARARSKDPRKTAQQDRSRATVDAIFDAMDRVVGEVGVDEFNLVTIAREAGIKRASIYDYFPTREALLAAWEERIFSQQMVRGGERLVALMTRQPGFEEAVVELVEFVMASFLEQAKRFKYTHGLELSGITKQRAAFVERIVAMIVGAVEHAPKRARVRVERLDLAARIIVECVLHMANVLSASDLSEEEHRARRREVATMVYRYLLRDPRELM